MIARGRTGQATPGHVTRDVMDALARCYDPCCRERELSIVDMGLVEHVRVDPTDDGAAVSTVTVDLVLTTGWCPSVAGIDAMVVDEVGRVDGVNGVDVNFVFDPVWTPDRLSERARDALSIDLHPLEQHREARLAAERATSATPVEVSR